MIIPLKVVDEMTTADFLDSARTRLDCFLSPRERDALELASSTFRAMEVAKRMEREHAGRTVEARGEIVELSDYVD